MNPSRNAAAGLAGLLAVAAIVGAARPARAGSVTYEIKIDSAAAGLAAGPGGLVDLTLSTGMPASTATVDVSAFNVGTDGTLVPPPVTRIGTTTGDFSGTVGMNNSLPTSELTEKFTVGSFFDIFVTLSGPEIGPGSSVATGSVLTLTEVDGKSKPDQAFASLIVNPDYPPTINGHIGIMTSGAGVTVSLVAVPEPSGLVLLGMGLGALAAACLRRRAPAA